MTTPISNSPFLRLQRNFPQDSTQALTVEIDKAYVDIANSVNNRTIGIYPTNSAVTTGEAWYLGGSNSKQQSLRQIYPFTSTANILHGINFAGISQISPLCKGSYTDGTNWYGLIFDSPVAIAGQITFYVTPTNIVFVTGGGAPTLTSGTIVLEWISRATNVAS